MGGSATARKVASLKRTLAAINQKIKKLEEAHYDQEGPEYSALELERSRKAAELTEAEQNLLREAA